MRQLLPLAASMLLLGGCVPVPSAGTPRPGAPIFPVFRFFEGRSEGTGTLKIAFRSSEPVRVESFGSVLPDGSLRLRQTIREGAKPPRKREWRIREVAPGRYAGTLSDAAGPVTGEAGPGRLHLAFQMKGGVAAEQWLVLSTDGRSAHNVLVARKLGFTVAALDEMIRRLD